ncbi:MAG: biotin transporter BioY [Pseudomonadota bacterium]
MNRSPLLSLLMLIAGIAVLALASRIAIPMAPVPITLQTLAVTVIGALYGWRLGVATVVAWLVLAVAGLPVLAEGASGIARFTGASGGFLFAFPIAALCVGQLTESGVADRWVGAIAVMTAGTLICLTGGWLWLGARIGLGGAFAIGVAPYLAGALIKTLVGAAIVSGWRRSYRSSRNAATSPRSTE